MRTFSNRKVTLVDLKVDLGVISLEGTSSGTRQGQGVGDVLVILYLDLEVVSFEGTSSRVNMDSRPGAGGRLRLFSDLKVAGNPGFEYGFRGDLFRMN